LKAFFVYKTRASAEALFRSDLRPTGQTFLVADPQRGQLFVLHFDDLHDLRGVRCEQDDVHDLVLFVPKEQTFRVGDVHFRNHTRIVVNDRGSGENRLHEPIRWLCKHEC
jgi:hypothetical protein